MSAGTALHASNDRAGDRTRDLRIETTSRARAGSFAFVLTRDGLYQFKNKRSQVVRAVPSRSEPRSHCLSHRLTPA
jgi:hypothetical protein